MSSTADTIQQETAGLQAKFTALKAAIDTFAANSKAQNAALAAQISALEAAGVDPTLLAPLADLQNQMQAETDAVTALSSPPTPAPTPTPSPAPTPGS